MTRTRRNWTPEEDAALRRAVNKALAQSRPLLWRELAKSVPGRTNKDCRRRWWNSLSAGTAKGPWSEEEDVRLIEAVRKYGYIWTNVAQAVMTRNADQCSSHWSQVLDPAINHCDWTPTEDAQLLHEVLTHGTNWATIATTHAPKRTTLGLKNRYSTLRLWNQNHSKNMSLQDQHQHMETKSNEGETITVLPTPGRSRADDQEDEDYYDDDDDDDDGEDDDEYDGEGGTDSGATENGEVLGPPDRTRTGGSDHGQHASVSGAAVALNLKEIYDDRYDRQHLHRSSGEVALQTSPTPTLLQPQPSQLTPSPSSAASSSGGSASMTTDSTCMTAGTSTTTINAGMPVSSSGTWTPNSASMLSFDYPPPPPQPLELGGLPRDYAQFYNDMMESIPQSSHSCQKADTALDMMDMDTAPSSRSTAPASRCSPVAAAFCTLHHTDHYQPPCTCTGSSNSPNHDTTGHYTTSEQQQQQIKTREPQPTTFYQVTLDIVCKVGQIEAIMTSIEREVGVTASMKIAAKRA